MVRYETLLLARTELTDDDASMIERQFDKIISDAGGKLDTFDKWGKYKLAYPVKKDSHGVFILARYQLPETQTAKVLNEMDLFMKIKCNELIMRHVNVKINPDSPMSYIKPEPIDISRSGSIDTFLKENKFENLLSSVDMAQARMDHDSNGDDTGNDNE
jgi:small subunit ribosomal protein S6